MNLQLYLQAISLMHERSGQRSYLELFLDDSADLHEKQ
jgi:hypothetical protein